MHGPPPRVPPPCRRHSCTECCGLMLHTRHHESPEDLLTRNLLEPLKSEGGPKRQASQYQLELVSVLHFVQPRDCSTLQPVASVGRHRPLRESVKLQILDQILPCRHHLPGVNWKCVFSAVLCFVQRSAQAGGALERECNHLELVAGAWSHIKIVKPFSCSFLL